MTTSSSPWAAARRLFAALERRFVPDNQGVDFSRVRAALGARPPRGSARRGGRHRGVGLEDLVGLDAQRVRVVANVTQFVAGLPANNMLLWGARGTEVIPCAGSESFSDQGLRLLKWSVMPWDLPEISAPRRLALSVYTFLR